MLKFGFEIIYIFFQIIYSTSPFTLLNVDVLLQQDKYVEKCFVFYFYFDCSFILSTFFIFLSFEDNYNVYFIAFQNPYNSKSDFFMSYNHTLQKK